MPNPNKSKTTIAKEIITNFKIILLSLVAALTLYTLLYVSTTPDYFTQEEISEEALQIKIARSQIRDSDEPGSSVTGFSMRDSKYMNFNGMVAGMSMEDRNRIAEKYFMKDIKDISIKSFLALLCILIAGRYLINIIKWANTASKEV